ncbi:DoxX family protein [bacterium]|nr:DoxX family protein [bacterium]
MNKRNKIIYWVASIWLALAMLASAVQQIFNIGGFEEIMERLDYPPYFSVIIGIWKVAGVVVLLLPRLPTIKEWAYAGFFFVMTGALFSHIAVGDPLTEAIPSIVLLVMVLTSWYFRPLNRKLNMANP